MSLDEIGIDRTKIDVPQKLISYKTNLQTMLLLAAIFLGITALGGYRLSWIWTGYPGNTLWDWMKLLLLPAGLVAAELFFQSGPEWKGKWTIAFGVVFSFLLITILGGYLLNWTWTGFQGNTLWQWFNLFLQPVGLAAFSIFFGFEREWKGKWTIAFGVVFSFLLITILGGYLLNWTWTGFQGNTLWDWIKLFFLPVTLTVSAISFKGHKREWTVGIAVATVFLLVAAIGGHRLNWTWTGFQGNTLWDWLKLLLLPIALAAAKPLFYTYPEEGIALSTVAAVFLLVAAIGGYLLNWTWTGFQGNTLWDWLTLFALPVGLVVAQIAFGSRRIGQKKIETSKQVLAVSSPDTTELLVGKENSSVIAEPERSILTTSTPPVPMSLDSQHRRQKRLVILTVAAILLILIEAGLSTFVFSQPLSSSSSAAAAAVVGNAAFFSTQEHNNESVHINDGLRLQLQGIADPPLGSKYYAWLQDNQASPVSLGLGVITPHHGTASLSYTNPQHRDLLATMSNVVITQESTNGVPNSPTQDKGLWLYSGALPGTHTSTDEFSFLDHMRDLLSNDPFLEHLHLHGGVDFWFLHNIQKLQEETHKVKDDDHHTHIQEIQQQLTNILFYLDGKCAHQDLHTIHLHTGPENNTIAHDTSIGLLDCAQAPESPGYLTLIQNHLSRIAHAPGVTSEQAQKAIQTDKDLDTIHTWLEQVRTNALQLLAKDESHLQHAHAQRDDIASQASFVVDGEAAPGAHPLHPGAQQVINTIGQLACFDIKKDTI